MTFTLERLENIPAQLKNAAQEKKRLLYVLFHGVVPSVIPCPKHVPQVFIGMTALSEKLGNDIEVIFWCTDPSDGDCNRSLSLEICQQYVVVHATLLMNFT